MAGPMSRSRPRSFFLLCFLIFISGLYALSLYHPLKDSFEKVENRVVSVVHSLEVQKDQRLSHGEKLSLELFHEPRGRHADI